LIVGFNQTEINDGICWDFFVNWMGKLGVGGANFMENFSKNLSFNFFSNFGKHSLWLKVRPGIQIIYLKLATFRDFIFPSSDHSILQKNNYVINFRFCPEEGLIKFRNVVN
jgi:hypothetical protein